MFAALKGESLFPQRGGGGLRHLPPPPGEGGELPRQARLPRNPSRPWRRHRAGHEAGGHPHRHGRAPHGGTPPFIVECFDKEHNTCPINGSCRLKGALAQAVNAFYETLDRHTLRDLVGGTARRAHEPHSAPQAVDENASFKQASHVFWLSPSPCRPKTNTKTLPSTTPKPRPTTPRSASNASWPPER
jgi:hypothetical protein